MNTTQVYNAYPGKRPVRYRYGVYGLSEWVALIPAGKAKLRISFSGESNGGFGTAPATFETTDSSVARIIEKSAYFRNGRIRRLSSSAP